MAKTISMVYIGIDLCCFYIINHVSFRLMSFSSPICFLLWEVSFLELMKDSSHNKQENGFSPVWVLIWIFLLLRFVKAFFTVFTAILFFSLMHLYVPRQTFPPGRSPFTLRTWIRFFSRVNSTVAIQVTRLWEGLATGETCKRLIPYVCCLMSPKAVLPWKRLFTLGTWIRFFSWVWVDSTVLFEVTGIRKRLVTGVAGVRLISCVCPLVTLQFSRLIERLLTLGTLIGFLSSMFSHVMSTQCIRVGEEFGTLGAGVGHLSSMSPFVTLQFGSINIILVTLRASIWLFSGVYSHMYL